MNNTNYRFSVLSVGMVGLGTRSLHSLRHELSDPKGGGREFKWPGGAPRRGKGGSVKLMLTVVGVHVVENRRKSSRTADVPAVPVMLSGWTATVSLPLPPPRRHAGGIAGRSVHRRFSGLLRRWSVAYNMAVPFVQSPRALLRASWPRWIVPAAHRLPAASAARHTRSRAYDVARERAWSRASSRRHAANAHRGTGPDGAVDLPLSRAASRAETDVTAPSPTRTGRAASSPERRRQWPDRRGSADIPIVLARGEIAGTVSNGETRRGRKKGETCPV